MISKVRDITHDLLATLFPGICSVCRTHLDGGRWLCETCDSTMTALENRPSCLRCGSPVAVIDSPCQRCHGRGIRPFRKIVHGGLHEDPAKHLIHRIKYHSGWEIAEKMVDRALVYPHVTDLLDEIDVIIPTPLHPLKHIWRGFNQADVIARRLARSRRIQVCPAAIRLRNTSSQTTQTSRKARIDNLRNAFACVKPNLIKGKHLLLVDDVFTTGATLRSLARSLHIARPASMSVFVLVTADHTGRGFDFIEIFDF